MVTIRPRTSRVLTGVPGRDGFLYHDGHGQPLYQAAPGLLGLLEGRQMMARWRRGIVVWVDGSGHFFNHIAHELAGEPDFEPLRAEIEAIRTVDAPPVAASRFLFQYLTTVAGGLEREAIAGRRRTSPAARLPPSLSLNGEWTAYYRKGPGEYASMPVKLPVNWELLPDISNYAGSMRFTRVLALPDDLGDRRLCLQLEGVDYFADLWVNGHYVGGHEGFFSPFQFDVTPYVRPGEPNVLRLAVTSPNEPAGDGAHVASAWNDFRPASYFPNRKTLVKGTLGHHDAKRGGAWSSLTSQDGNTGGVWGSITLHSRPPIHFDPSQTRVTTVGVRPSRSGGGSAARLHVRFTTRNTTGRRVRARLHVELTPGNFEGPAIRLDSPVTVKGGLTRLTLEREVSGVRLWEPWDQGHPHLYTVRAVLEVDGEPVDETVLETGFRTLAVTPLGESAGPHGAFVVNGHRVFVRGTNLLPTYWLSEYTEERAARDFRMLRAAGFNAVLVHALVAPKRLYEHANRAGIMVVQLAPLQWSYEQSADFVARATQQLREMAAFLANEPSVVSYEAHNEPDMRTAGDVDNRAFDFVLHAALREADPFRWATTFSGGNHCYPGQFYGLRDDNSFATLPGRFEHDTHNGRRIARHRNMPTEFGIQGMPHEALFEELLSEDRVRAVLHRLRPGRETDATLTQVTRVLGGGSWEATLEAFDWRRLWRLGSLDDDMRALRSRRRDDRELAETRLALVLLDVLHYGAFKGENFWFGDWKPARTRAEFVTTSQNRQYRIHKEAIECYLNAGSTGPIAGFFSFMFRDADWQAPTWGVIDASWVPKKAYRAYVESNQPVRVTLPQALQSPVKLTGDPWFGAPEGRARPVKEPWATGELLVANDTAAAWPGARVALWVEDDQGARVDRGVKLTVDLAPRRGFSYFDEHPEVRAATPPGRWTVPDTLPAGTYFLKASITSASGERLSTNSYELVVLGAVDVPAALIEGLPDRAGFHYWEEGGVAHAARPGIRGLVEGFRHAERSGIDVYEVIQGEHLLRHLIAELDGVPGSEALLDLVWTIRSEVISPAEKADVLLRALKALAGGTPLAPATRTSVPARPRHRAHRAVGRDAGAFAPRNERLP